MIKTDYIRETYPEDAVLHQFAAELDLWAPLIGYLDALRLRDHLDKKSYGVRGGSSTWSHNVGEPITLTLTIDLLIKEIWK